MRLGISYNVWDNWEMLESSITVMKPVVDHISIVFQEKSNHGESIDTEEVLEYLKDLRDRGLINVIMEYKPDEKKSPHQNEIAKRQVGYNTAREAECTHFLSIDTDEFYDPEQFEYAKMVIERDGYDASICELVNYYGDFKHQIEHGGFVPFIYRIDGDRQFQFGNVLTTTVICDPTRQIRSTNICRFSSDRLVMHHMSYVRNGGEGMRLKLENSSAKENWSQDVIDEMVEYYDKWTPELGGMTIKNVMRGRVIDSNATVVRPLRAVENNFEYISYTKSKKEEKLEIVDE